METLETLLNDFYTVTQNVPYAVRVDNIIERLRECGLTLDNERTLLQILLVRNLTHKQVIDRNGHKYHFRAQNMNWEASDNRLRKGFVVDPD